MLNEWQWAFKDFMQGNRKSKVYIQKFIAIMVVSLYIRCLKNKKINLIEIETCEGENIYTLIIYY